jgi:hypothetical protein
LTPADVAALGQVSPRTMRAIANGWLSAARLGKRIGGEADGGTRTPDPFITRPLRRFAAVSSSRMKSLQTAHFCRFHMTTALPPKTGLPDLVADPVRAGCA